MRVPLIGSKSCHPYQKGEADARINLSFLVRQDLNFVGEDIILPPVNSC